MFVRIYANGTILYSVRLSLTCSCLMHLQLYPLDVQHCDFDLISYAHTERVFFFFVNILIDAIYFYTKLE